MLKKKAIDCLSDQALMEDDILDVSQSDLEQFCKNMYDVQASVHPPLWKSLVELHSSLSNFDHLTMNKVECFLLVNIPHQSIVILSTPSNLQHLSQASTILVDDTFYFAPHLFTQLFTMDSAVDGTYP